MADQTDNTPTSRKSTPAIVPALPDPFPPKIASDWGQDSYGLWMGIRYKDIRQGFRWIPPGNFLMGSPDHERQRDGDEVQHRVSLTRGFWLADTACTQALWQAVTGENPSEFKGKNLPVDSVSWEDCQAFLDQINSDCPGLDLGLPTEAQWEYACRNPQEIDTGEYTPFSFGQTIATDQVNYDGNHPYGNGKKGEFREKTVPVKRLSPNDRGLYQMHGNLWEWCRDWYGEYGSEPTVDPIGSDDGESRVLRGGDWFYDARLARSAFRYRGGPGYRHRSAGFRVSRGQPGRLD